MGNCDILNWRKLALSSAVVLGMMTVAGTAYGFDDVYLTNNCHTASTTLDNATKVTWNSPLHTTDMDVLNAKLGDADVRTEIIREAGFMINGQKAMHWHSGSISVNGQQFDGYLTFKSSRLLSVGSTARIVVKFKSVYDIQFQVLYQVSANGDQSESWYGAQGMYVGIQQGERPATPEDSEAPKPENPETGWTTGPIDAPNFSDWTTLPSVPLQTPDTGDVTIDGNTVGGKGDTGDINIDGNTVGGKPDTGDITAPVVSGEGDTNVTNPDTPVVDDQNNANDSNEVNTSDDSSTSAVTTPDESQTGFLTNETAGLVAAGVNTTARTAVFGDYAPTFIGSYTSSNQPTLSQASSNSNQARLASSSAGRDLIHDMIVSEDAKRSNALKLEQAGVRSEWFTMVAGAIHGFLFAFFRRRREERDKENETR